VAAHAATRVMASDRRGLWRLCAYAGFLDGGFEAAAAARTSLGHDAIPHGLSTGSHGVGMLDGGMGEGGALRQRRSLSDDVQLAAQQAGPAKGDLAGVDLGVQAPPRTDHAEAGHKHQGSPMLDGEGGQGFGPIDVLGQGVVKAGDVAAGAREVDDGADQAVAEDLIAGVVIDDDQAFRLQPGGHRPRHAAIRCKKTRDDDDRASHAAGLTDGAASCNGRFPPGAVRGR
jgi:hypothetical protein